LHSSVRVSLAYSSQQSARFEENLDVDSAIEQAVSIYLPRRRDFDGIVGSGCIHSVSGSGSARVRFQFASQQQHGRCERVRREHDGPAK